MFARSLRASSSRLARPSATPNTCILFARRTFATETDLPEGFDINAVEREADEVDICIVGGGPAGLSAAIRLKQLEAERGGEVRVVVLEKGAEVGKFYTSHWH